MMPEHNVRGYVRFVSLKFDEPLSNAYNKMNHRLCFHSDQMEQKQAGVDKERVERRGETRSREREKGRKRKENDIQ